MDMAQVQSFVYKFQELWAAGLRVQLSNQVHQQQQHPSRPPQHRSPAYHRRQERQRQAA